MKRVLITGAGGFVGRHLCQLLLKSTDWQLVLLDNSLPEIDLSTGRVEGIEGQLQATSTLESAFAENVDVIYHLAAVPGGAAEQDPHLSRSVNIDSTLDLLERAAAQNVCPRVVYASTIAVLGAPMPAHVDDCSPVAPAMTYGTHKAMIELALADFSRRGLLDTVAVRLPGIIARPPSNSGLKSAFLSNAFHQLAAGSTFTSPVSPDATMWLMSVQQCARNLYHAVTLDTSTMPERRVVTLPALRVTMKALLNTIVAQTGGTQSLITWQPDSDLEAGFGRQPPLSTPAADRAGFIADKDIDALVAAGLSVTTQ